MCSQGVSSCPNTGGVPNILSPLEIWIYFAVFWTLRLITYTPDRSILNKKIITNKGYNEND